MTRRPPRDQWLANGSSALPDDVLDAFNARWRPRLQRLRGSLPAPWWGPGLQLTPEIRWAYEQSIPMRHYGGDLARLFRATLPHPSWVPMSLRPVSFASLPDFWSAVVPAYGGRVAWKREDIVPLACSLASPGRFGTRANRYPEQRGLIDEWLAGGARPRLVLDIGCGTGQGTWALAARLAEWGAGAAVLGVTREPLEAWMATRRCLPHATDPRRAAAFPPAPLPAGPVHFVAGDLRTLTLRAVADILICNGLVGGPMMYREDDLSTVWEQFARLAKPGALLILGDHFHDGRRRHTERFLALGGGRCRHRRRAGSTTVLILGS